VWRMSEIIPGRLYLGDAWDGHEAGAKNPKRLTHVLNVSDQLTLKPGYLDTQVLAEWVPIADDGTDDVFGLGGAWWRCREFLQDAFGQKHSRVLVHCAMGINRSATIVAAWLMETRSLPAAAALRFLQERRRIVHPISGHREQLEAFQRHLGISSCYNTWRSFGRRVCGLCAAICSSSNKLKFLFRVLASVAAGLACWSMAAQGAALRGPLAGPPAWDVASCRVLALGAEKLCGPMGNYTPCGPYLWCAEEGGMCDCHGTVRYAPVEKGIDAQAVERPAAGNVRCSGQDFGWEQAVHGRRRCLCRPTGLRHISDAVVGPAACALSASVSPADQPRGRCGTAAPLLPWALVEVSGAGFSGEARCAYSHGLPELSRVASSTAVADALQGLQPGSKVDCQVAGERGNGCLVALAQPRAAAVAELERDSKQEAEARFRRCWFLIGLGFLSVGLSPALDLIEVGKAENEACQPLLESA